MQQQCSNCRVLPAAGDDRSGGGGGGDDDGDDDCNVHVILEFCWNTHTEARTEEEEKQQQQQQQARAAVRIDPPQAFGLLIVSAGGWTLLPSVYSLFVQKEEKEEMKVEARLNHDTDRHTQINGTPHCCILRLQLDTFARTQQQQQLEDVPSANVRRRNNLNGQVLFCLKRDSSSSRKTRGHRLTELF